MKVDQFEVRLKKESLYLWTLGDVGYGGARFDAKSFGADVRYLTQKKREGHKVKIFSPGDCLAAPSPSERAAWISAKGGKGYYDASLDDADRTALKHCDDFAAELQEFTNDFLFMLSGHHLYEFSRRSIHYGINSDQYLAKKFNASYSPKINYVSLVFPNQGQTYNLVAHHGNGAGRLPGAAINRRFHVHSAFDADAVYAGHDNKRAADCANFIYKDNKGETHYREMRSICIGAYERAYEIDKDGMSMDGYVEEGVMQPSALGAQITLFEPFDGKLRIRALV